MRTVHLNALPTPDAVDGVNAVIWSVAAEQVQQGHEVGVDFGGRDEQRSVLPASSDAAAQVLRQALDDRRELESRARRAVGFARSNQTSEVIAARYVDVYTRTCAAGT